MQDREVVSSLKPGPNAQGFLIQVPMNYTERKLGKTLYSSIRVALRSWKLRRRASIIQMRRFKLMFKGQIAFALWAMTGPVHAQTMDQPLNWSRYGVLDYPSASNQNGPAFAAQVLELSAELEELGGDLYRVKASGSLSYSANPFELRQVSDTGDTLILEVTDRSIVHGATYGCTFNIFTQVNIPERIRQVEVCSANRKVVVAMDRHEPMMDLLRSAISSKSLVRFTYQNENIKAIPEKIYKTVDDNDGPKVLCANRNGGAPRVFYVRHMSELSIDKKAVKDLNDHGPGPAYK